MLQLRCSLNRRLHALERCCAVETLEGKRRGEMCMKQEWKRLGTGVLATVLAGSMLLGSASAAAGTRQGGGAVASLNIKDLVNQAAGREESEDDSQAEDHDVDFVEAEFTFDAASGTILKVTVSESGYLDIPMEINGVTVKRIAPYAIQGLPVIGVYLPHTIELVDSVIVADCQELQIVSIAPTTRVTTRVYENCPLLGKKPMDYGATPYFEKEIFQPYPSTGIGKSVNMPQGLMKKLGVFQGNGNNMNWEATLTRVEAVTVLLRLLGQEEEAKAAAAWEPAFTDVPQWALGYVNLAYKQGMVKGVGAGLFNPNGLCGAQEFSLMVLRLTDYKEGADYGWNTSVRDLQGLISESRTMEGENAEIKDGQLFNMLYNDSLTRELSCALLYRALSAPMADGKTSLADVLCAEHGLPVSEMANFEVRLTAAAVGGRIDAGMEADQHRVRNLMASMDDVAKWEAAEENKTEVTVSRQIQELTDQITAGLTSDYDKARAICKWIADNIAYNHDEPEITSEALLLQLDADYTLEQRRGICGGFTALTKSMMWAAGIPCVSVKGRGGASNSMGLPGYHSWNEVYADGRWFPVDNTWDCQQDYRNGTTVSGSNDGYKYFDMDRVAFYDLHDCLFTDRNPESDIFY